MKFVPAAFENEILSDPTERTDSAKARSRMSRITASEREQLLYKCAPNQARNNDRPGIPDENYSD